MAFHEQQRVPSGPSVPTRARFGVGRLLALTALLLPFCYRDTRPPCDNPPPFYLTLEADQRLNPDDQQRSLPTQFLVLQLRGGAKFEKAAFDDVWQHPKDSLGDELVAQNELSVAPGTAVTTGFQRNGQATYVAVIGIFRKHAGDSWRAIAQLTQAPSNKCTAQPISPKPKPAEDDLILKFHTEDDRVENRTPAPQPHSGCS